MYPKVVLKVKISCKRITLVKVIVIHTNSNWAKVLKYLIINTCK